MQIGDLRFFRSKEYQEYFRHLDRKGGFYSERVREFCTSLRGREQHLSGLPRYWSTQWGDAPVRALALGALAGLDRIH